MNKWIFLLSLVLATPVFANQAANATTFFFAEALIWQIREGNASNWAQILYPNSANETIQFFEVPFKWSPGLRIGAGFNGQEKPWNILFYYTGYKTQGTNRANTDTGELHSAFSSNFYASNPQGNGISGPYYHHAGIEWDVDYNALDFELGRSINIDTLVAFRPFSGLKAGSINQTIQSIWQDPFQPTTSVHPNPTPIPTFTSATETITNKFKGLGPLIGMDSAWHLYTTPTQTINLIGNFSGAFLWGHWKFTDIYRNNAPQTIATVSDGISSSATMARGYLGIEWSSIINNANWTLRLGYEEQVWFNQLQYYSFDMGKTSDALYLQGAVLGFGVHF